MFFEQRKDSSVESDFARWDKKELSMDDVPTGVSKEVGFRLFIVRKWQSFLSQSAGVFKLIFSYGFHREHVWFS